MKSNREHQYETFFTELALPSGLLRQMAGGSGSNSGSGGNARSKIVILLIGQPEFELQERVLKMQNVMQTFTLAQYKEHSVTEC